MIQMALRIVIALFPLSEISLAFLRRSRGVAMKREDRGSLRLLWLCILIGVILAFLAQGVSSARLPLSARVVRIVALALMTTGLALRWTAILTLGRFFTVDVAIHPDHAVVESGLYRYMRHPSYTGLLVAFLGFGLSFSNWLSLVVLLLPISLGVLYRVAREEKALLESLGPAYADYRARTRRFVPGLF